MSLCMNCREQVWMCMTVHVHVPEQLCMTLTEPKSKVAKSKSHHPESISGPLARMNRPRARLISGPLAKVVGHGIRDGHIHQAATTTLAVEASGEAFLELVKCVGPWARLFVGPRARCAGPLARCCGPLARYIKPFLAFLVAVSCQCHYHELPLP